MFFVERMGGPGLMGRGPHAALLWLKTLSETYRDCRWGM